jgi:hypothetical protein
MSKLVIIVPVSRPEFVPIIQAYHENTWQRICNKTKQLIELVIEFGIGLPPSGANIRQEYLEKYRGKSVYLHWLDDDNLISPDVLEFIHSRIFKADTPEIFMFGQIWWANGIKRLNATPENCKPCQCDIAQLFVHASLLDGINWGNRYENDGDLIKELYQKHSDKFNFHNNIDAWYKALRPNQGLYNGQIKLIA